MKKLTIQRLDYKNVRPNGGYGILPQVHDIKEIEDINEIQSIGIICDTKEEAIEVFNLFPKYLRFRNGTLGMEEAGKNVRKPYIFAHFDTFWSTKKTGELNEAAIKRRKRAIEVIKTLQIK